ncbi:MAG: glutaredoxin family protein [Nitrospiraceae bacterium]|nr:glutaredoxin family protein [Nitrospiraceae bacterium]MDA8432422.1 glutaredoxin family protein [Nitrospiraceae bacterium]
MKEFLSAKGVQFLNKDIATDRSAREELASKHGRLATPTLVIDGRVFLGFRQNREEIEKLIDKTGGAQ